MNDVRAQLLCVLKTRIEEFPHDLRYRDIEFQVGKIVGLLDQNGRLSTDDYNRVTIGVLCARELEAEDLEVCESVYDFLDSVEPENYSIASKYT